MIADLPSCEWVPQSNRSVISIERAAERLPLEDRAELVEAFNRRIFDDQVRITRDAITSASYAYSPQIRFMNFGSGRRCKVVTRNRWKSTHEESAIVFHLDTGRSYGYAASCGNLFSLRRLKDLRPKLPAISIVPTPIGFAIAPVPFLSETTSTEKAQPLAFVPDVEYLDSPSISAQSFAYVYGATPFLDPNAVPIGPRIPDVPIAPIPELPAWMYFATGIGLMALLLRGWRRPR